VISVIIPTADRPGPLHRALRSLARQTHRDFETVIVRDGGLPARPVVDAWQHELRLTLVDRDTRGGVSAARNAGLAAASGEYVAFLDDDDIFFPEHLALAHRALAGNEADLVYGGALVSPRWIEALPRSTRGLPRKDYPFDDACTPPGRAPTRSSPPTGPGSPSSTSGSTTASSTAYRSPATSTSTPFAA
jgi:glycosyltransferase involved in cell wall biosynthesis